MLDFCTLECNEFQKKAICHNTGPVLVVAGPGSGKTFVITHRIQYLIQNLGVSAQNILVITFTKNAASEMKARTMSLVGNKASGISFGTFHSLFFNIICHAGGYTKGSVIEEKIKKNLILRFAESLEIVSSDTDELYMNIQGDISRYKMHKALTLDFEPRSMSSDKFEVLVDKYERYMEEQRLLDFDDLIIKTYRILKKNEHYRLTWQDKFKYILIDEFQDIDSIQFEIIKMLVNKENNIFAVGDDDQSIYGFRGARPEIMLGFKNEFKDAEIIELSVNYRSVKNIVDISSNVIVQNKARYSKMIRANTSDLGVISIEEFDDRDDEARYIKDFVKHHEGEEADIAILFRTNRVAKFYMDFLRDNNINVNGAKLGNRLCDHFMTKDIMAYLRMAYGDQSRANFLKIMNKPYRGFQRIDLPEVINFEDILKNNNIYSEDYENFNKLYSGINIIKKLPVYGAVHYILNVFEYSEYLRAYAIEREIDYLELKETANKLYEISKQANDLNSFKQLINNSNISEDESDNGIKIMTMHGSKGLEFNYIIIPEAIEGVIPLKQAVSEDEIEEERRIMYVAMTRAKKELHILYPKNYLGRQCARSRFININENSEE